MYIPSLVWLGLVSLCNIAVILIQPYTYTCGNIVNTIMTNKHTLEKYTFHTLFEMVAKGLCVRGELETEQTARYWPPVPLSLAALLSRSAGQLNRGSWGSHRPLLGAGSLYSILSLTRVTPPNWTSCRTGLYHCFTSTCFLWASHLHPVQPVHSQGYTLISSTGCTCSLIDGWIEGQYVTFVLLHINLWGSFNAKPTIKKKRHGAIKTIAVDSYLCPGYWSKSERNDTTGVRACLQCRSQAG